MNATGIFTSTNSSLLENLLRSSVTSTHQDLASHPRMKRAKVLVGAGRIELIGELPAGVADWRLQLVLCTDDRTRSVISVRPPYRAAKLQRGGTVVEPEAIQSHVLRAGRLRVGLERHISDCNRVIHFMK